jgi:choline dehydrogenase-like flavoprotein
MANLVIDTIKARTYDAIVIGSGISGGWAAKELCQKGLKTLVLERGRQVEHIKDYPTTNLNPWDFKHRGSLPLEKKAANPIASRCYAFDATTEHFFVKDQEHAYVQERPFDWIRGYQVGGKSLMWARWTQRWSDLDFEANARDGIAVDWPIRYKDLAPWYSYVEKFVGISGNRDGLSQVPDGEFLPPFDMNCMEKHVKEKIESGFPGRNLIISRTANLSQAQQIHQNLGRANCQARNLCHRGCPYGGYFSSNSATLPAARTTGNLTLQPDSVVHSVIYDEQKQKATGVRVIHTHTKEMTEYYAKIIFVNASTLNTTLLLLHSTSGRFPQGLGNDSGALGHYLMDHNYRVRVRGTYSGFQDQYYYGRRPTGVYLPRFRNVGADQQSGFLRGYAYAGGGSREGWPKVLHTNGFGAALKEEASHPGLWQFSLTGMGEMLPEFSNQVSLLPGQPDAWGMPTLKIDCGYGANEEAMTKDIITAGAEMLEKAGLSNIQATDSHQAPGLGIHEMGTARMGRDPKTSVLNGFNQMHSVPNVFVTDGACMTSGACQNPSLTYMALTARAVDHAIKESKRRNL